MLNGHFGLSSAYLLAIGFRRLMFQRMAEAFPRHHPITKLQKLSRDLPEPTRADGDPVEENFASYI